MNIGLLGFLGGSAQAVSNKFQQEYESSEKEKERIFQTEMAQTTADLNLRNDQAMALLQNGLQKDIAQFTHTFDLEKIQKQYEYQGDNQRTLAELNADLEKGLISVRSAHELAGQSHLSLLNSQIQEARDNRNFGFEKQLLKIKDDYAKGSLGLQHSYNLSIRAYEHQLAKAQTVEERAYLKERLQELQDEAEQAAKLGNPFLLPAGIQGYNWDGKDTNQLGIAGLTSGDPRNGLVEGVDATSMMFLYQDRHGNNTYVPGVDVKVRKDARSRMNQRVVNVLNAVGPELWWHIENQSPVLDQIRKELVANMDKDELRKSIELPQGSDAQGLVIQNPVKAFALTSFITRDGMADPASQRWFAENVLKDALGMSEEAIKYALGMPEEVELGYDMQNDAFIAPPAASYQWATVFDFNGTGKARLNPEIREEAMALAFETNLNVGVVLSTFKDFQDPMKALKAVYNDRATMRGLLKDGYPTPAFLDSMERKIKDNGLDPTQGIMLTRMYLNDNPYQRADSFIIEGDTAKPQFNKRMKDLYAIDREEARAKARAAKASIRIATQMKDISSTFRGVKAGRIGEVRLALAGMGELIQDFRILMNQMGDKVDFEPGSGKIMVNMEDINSLEKELINLSNNPELADVNRLQSVFNMLGETLAYNQAAVAQGGAQGRDISDNDVRNWKRKLGFEGTFIYSPGVEENLNNLIYENQQISEIYGAYANAQTETDFRAVFIYEEAVGILPTDYTQYNAGGTNIYSDLQVDEGNLIRQGTVNYKVNGQSRTFPLN